MEETIARYQTEMEELQKSRKEIIKQAKEEAERILQESNARIENTIRTIKEAQAEKEKTRLARQELTDFRRFTRCFLRTASSSTSCLTHYSKILTVHRES